jgi:hypothetical protein
VPELVEIGLVLADELLDPAAVFEMLKDEDEPNEGLVLLFVLVLEKVVATPA